MFIRSNTICFFHKSFQFPWIGKIYLVYAKHFYGKCFFITIHFWNEFLWLSLVLLFVVLRTGILMPNVGIGELRLTNILLFFFSKWPHDGVGISPPVALQCNVVGITAWLEPQRPEIPQIFFRGRFEIRCTAERWTYTTHGDGIWHKDRFKMTSPSRCTWAKSKHFSVRANQRCTGVNIPSTLSLWFLTFCR